MRLPWPEDYRNTIKRTEERNCPAASAGRQAV